MLDQLRAQFSELPTAPALRKALESLFRELAPMGVLNALLTEGRCLYAFCTKPLFYIERSAPFGRATLIDEDCRSISRRSPLRMTASRCLQARRSRATSNGLFCLAEVEHLLRRRLLRR